VIDHTIRYASEAEAIAALPQYRVGEGKEAAWDTSRCNPGVRVYRVTETTTDGESNTVETRDYVEGWFITIGLPREDQILNKLASATIVNRETKARSKVDSVVAAKAGWRVEPVFAGT